MAGGHLISRELLFKNTVHAWNWKMLVGQVISNKNIAEKGIKRK